MPSQDGNSNQRGRAPDKGSARRGDGQRWGRGFASALERMKELERRHSLPEERSGGAREREPGGPPA